jgi:hypothetical protein
MILHAFSMISYALPNSTLYQGLFTVVTKGRDQSFSCIVIGGKVGAGPSSLYTVKSDQGLQWMTK